MAGNQHNGKGKPSDRAPRGEWVKRLADAICKTNYFARDAGGKLFRYDEGAYREGGDRFIRQRVKSLLNAWDAVGEWTISLTTEVVEYIAVDAPELWDRPPMDRLNLRNGLLRVVDRELLPHDPSHLTTVQLPVEYRPDADCPAIDKFVADAFPADAESLAWEMAAWLMLPDVSVQKAVLLTGEGGNGKSVWLRLLTAFIGKRNTASVSLHKLEANPFAVSRLIGKLANVCADLPSEHLAGTSVFKQLVGGDSLDAEYKFRDSFDLYPFVRLIFSANHPPRSTDASKAFFDRWIVLPFDRCFRGTKDEIPKAELDAALQSPSELSGLLNRALAVLPEFRARNGFSTPESVLAAWQEFHATTDPLAVWLDRAIVEAPEAVIPKKTLRAAYAAACERSGRPALSDKAFGGAFARLKPTVALKQRTYGGRVQWCYLGIGLASDAPGDDENLVNPVKSPVSDSHDSQDSQDYSYLPPRERGRDEYVREVNRRNLVNPVNPVNGDCRHNDPRTYVHRDGSAYCPSCDRWMGRLPRASQGHGSPSDDEGDCPF